MVLSPSETSHFGYFLFLVLMQLRAFKFSYTHVETRRYKTMTSDVAQNGLKPTWRFMLAVSSSGAFTVCISN